MLALSDDALRRMLEDDAPCGDLTTATLGLQQDAAAQLTFRARRAMTVCGTEEASRLFALVGALGEALAPAGAQAAAGTLLLRAEGTVAQLHLAWKTAQTLVEWASGLATGAAAVVAAASESGRRVPVACTRKNVPGTKALSIKAVRAGGATAHRLGLSETLLLFPEHRLFLAEPPADTIARLRSQEPEKKIVVEVSSVEEAVSWARAGADVLQLEKFAPAAVADCRRLLPGHVLAPAGGVRADNAAAYVAAGADLLITSAPYAAPPCDVQVDFGSRA